MLSSKVNAFLYRKDAARRHCLKSIRFAPFIYIFPGATGHFLRFDPPPPLSSLEAAVPRPTYGSQRPSSQGLQQFGLQASLKPKDSKMETVTEHFEEDSGPNGLDPTLTAVLLR